MNTPWRIEMLGGLRATREGEVVSRFRSEAIGALLAYLALHAGRAHPRLSLVELHWPDADLDKGRNNLRVALTHLRQRLEPPGIPMGAIITANRRTVRLNPAAVRTDAAEFEAALASAARAGSAPEREERLAAAAAGYAGELLPGNGTAWVLPERQRLLEAYVGAVTELARQREQVGDLTGAVKWARRAVTAEPLEEEAQHDLIRLLVAGKRWDAARAQFADLRERLEREAGVEPAARTRALVAGLEGRGSPERSPRSRPAVPPVTPDGRPDPRPAVETRARLPLQFTRFFGREAEVAWLGEALERQEPSVPRLVTLTGPGGTGKTRVAVEVAERLRPAFAEAVWFVPLADLSDPRLIFERLVDALGHRHSPTVEPLEQVVAALARQPALLVLDNFEHLIAAAPPEATEAPAGAADGPAMVQTLRERVPSLTLLVTSRQRLHLPGEREFVLAPLSVPAAEEAPAALVRWDSVRLFLDRAQAVRPEFQVTAGNAAAIAGLCRRLEGIPLALELAAARVSVLTPQEMLVRLKEREGALWAMLVSRQRPVTARHQSLSAAIEWSYRLLSPELQQLFRRLSVFRGGCTVEAAVAICETPAALDALQRLRECSLLQVETRDEGTRFTMLETLREFGARALVAEAADPLGRRHAAYYLGLAEAAEPEWRGPRHRFWLHRLAREHGNLRAALDWALAVEPAETGLRLVGSLAQFWGLHGHLGEASRMLQKALAGSSEATSWRARALLGAGRIAVAWGDMPTAARRLREALTLFQTLGETPDVAEALLYLGTVAAA